MPHFTLYSERKYTRLPLYGMKFKKILAHLWTFLLWIVICISVCIMIHHDKIWRLLKHFFHRCISLHIMINHEVPGYIMKDPEGYWNSFDLSWCIMINCDISPSSMGKSFRISWKIMICIITFQRGNAYLSTHVTITYQQHEKLSRGISLNLVWVRHGAVTFFHGGVFWIMLCTHEL